MYIGYLREDFQQVVVYRKSGFGRNIKIQPADIDLEVINTFSFLTFRGSTNLICAHVYFLRLRICAEFFQLPYYTYTFPDPFSALIYAPKNDSSDCVTWMPLPFNLCHHQQLSLNTERHRQKMRGVGKINFGIFLPSPSLFWISFLSEAVFFQTLFMDLAFTSLH